MKLSDIKELYYISHIDNIQSIVSKGILCHEKAKKMKCTSVADPGIQKRRENKVVPGGQGKLHDYANLYFNARNPMMFKRKAIHAELSVICVSPSILNEPNVILSDGNASSNWA